MTLLESWAWWRREISGIQRFHLLCKVNFQKMNVRSRSQKCVWWILSHCERHGNSPHSDVVIDRLRIDDREVDVDAEPRRNPDCPHAVLEVRILGWVSGRINCAIHGCYIPTAESWRERSEQKNQVLNYQKARKRFLLLFMVIRALTLTGSARRQAAGGTQI